MIRTVLRTLLVIGGAVSLCAGAAAQTTPVAKPAARPAAKPAAKSAGRARRAPAAPVYVVPDATPDQVKAAELVYYGHYECEFNLSVDIAQSAKHSAYVDVKHGKSAWLMKPVLSSTGAIRLEDVGAETLMVQISSKSMLLNVKTGRRVVDECVSPKQRELIEAARVEKAAQEAAARAAANAPVAAASAASDAAAMASAPTATPPADAAASAASAAAPGSAPR